MKSIPKESIDSVKKMSTKKEALTNNEYIILLTPITLTLNKEKDLDFFLRKEKRKLRFI